MRDSDLPDVLTMFAGYLQAGIPAAQCAKKTGRVYPRYQNEFDAIAVRCEKGEGIASSMQKVKLLSRKNCEVIRNGETAGTLVAVIQDLVQVQRELNEFSKDIKKSLTSQAVTILVSIISTPYLLVFMAKQTPDLALQRFADFVDYLSSYIPYLGYLYPITVIAIITIIASSNRAKEAAFDVVSLVPYINTAILNWQLGNWSSLMSLSLKSGLTFQMAEKMLGEMLRPELRDAVRKVSDESILKGWIAACDNDKWSESDIRHVLPDLLLSFLMAGAERGTTEVQLKELSEMMTGKAKRAFQNITTMTFYGVLFAAAAIVLYLSVTVMNSRFSAIQGYI